MLPRDMPSLDVFDVHRASRARSSRRSTQGHRRDGDSTREKECDVQIAAATCVRTTSVKSDKREGYRREGHKKQSSALEWRPEHGPSDLPLSTARLTSTPSTSRPCYLLCRLSARGLQVGLVLVYQSGSCRYFTMRGISLSVDTISLPITFTLRHQIRQSKVALNIGS